QGVPPPGDDAKSGGGAGPEPLRPHPPLRHRQPVAHPRAAPPGPPRHAGGAERRRGAAGGAEPPREAAPDPVATGAPASTLRRVSPRRAGPLILFAPGAGAPSSSAWMKRWAKHLGTLGRVVPFDYPYMRA